VYIGNYKITLCKTDLQKPEFTMIYRMN